MVDSPCFHIDCILIFKDSFLAALGLPAGRNNCNESGMRVRRGGIQGDNNYRRLPMEKQEIFAIINVNPIFHKVTPISGVRSVPRGLNA